MSNLIRFLKRLLVVVSAAAITALIVVMYLGDHTFAFSFGFRNEAHRDKVSCIEVNAEAFKGSFFDYLCFLNLKYGLEFGVDPIAIRTNTDSILRRTSEFKLGPNEACISAVNEAVQARNLCMHKLGTATYITTNDDRGISALYESVAAGQRLSPKSSSVNASESDALVNFAQIQQSGKTFLLLSNTVTTQINKALNAFAVAELADRGTVLNPALFSGGKLSDPRGAKWEFEKAHRELNELLRIFLENWDALVRDLSSVPAVFRDVQDLIPQSVIQESYQRHLLVQINVCTMILDRGAKLFNEPRAVSDLLNILRKRQNFLLKKLSTCRVDNQRRREVYQSANDFWVSGDIKKAYLAFSFLLEGLDDYTSNARIGYAMTALKNRAKQIKALTLAAKADPSETPIAVTYMTGLTSESERVLREWLKIPGGTTLSSRAVMHPSRIGAVWGLTITGAVGHARTFAVEFADKGGKSGDIKKKIEPEKNTKDSEQILDFGKLTSQLGQDRNVEIYGQGQIDLDDYFVSSINDSLHYIERSLYPNLFDKRIRVLLDQSVDINYGGDSAGAAIALAAISQREKKPIRADLCVTGALRAYGDIRPVGGILLKALAAANGGFDVLLIPEDNLPEAYMLDRDDLSGIQIITCKSLNEYTAYAIPELSKRRVDAEKSLEAYAIAINLYEAHQFGIAMAMLRDVVEAFPNHFSALCLLKNMELAGITPTPIPVQFKTFMPKPL